MKKIKLIVLSVVAIIILIMLLPRIFNLFTSDIDPIDDSDLSLQVISVPDEDNAYFDLAKIEDVLYQPEGRRKEIMDIIDNKAWNQELAEDIISNNQQAFEFFSLAARKPKFQNPQFANPENISPNVILPSLSSYRTMSGYSSIKALYLSKQGNDKEAMDEALNSVYIGQKIQESQVGFIEYFSAIVMKERGLEAVRNIVALSNLNNDELKKYSSDVNLFYKNEDGLLAFIKGDYYYQLSIIDALINSDTEFLQYFENENLLFL